MIRQILTFPLSIAAIFITLKLVHDNVLSKINIDDTIEISKRHVSLRNAKNKLHHSTDRNRQLNETHLSKEMNDYDKKIFYFFNISQWSVEEVSLNTWL